MIDYGCEVVRCTAVVETERLIHLSAAAPVIPGQDVVAVVVQCLGHSFYVGPGCVAFKPVRNNSQLLRVAFQPVEIKEVIVGRVDPLTLIGRELHLPEL